MTPTTPTTPHSGWYLLAFRSELPVEPSPLAIGDRQLVALREGERVRVFDAACPHRGAHLGYGGRRESDCLVCPFHGRRIALGDSSRAWSVAEYPVLLWGDAVFARLSDDPAGDRGFERAVKEYADDYPLVPAVSLPVAVDAAYVVENAFDADHFKAVHKVPGVRGMTAGPGPSGELTVEGEFLMQTSPWQDERRKEEVRWQAIRTNTVRWDYRPRFLARAYSPGVVVTEFGPENDVQVIVTGAVPTAGGCTARVAVAVRENQHGALPVLIEGSRKALAEDKVVWEHLVPGAPERLDGRDAPVVAFRDFCADFPAAPEAFR
ncbi:Rieske 2Fe-2S domain-containing protein [Streptacidiphilus rugosus]|uniref:Rieske 2Fe-2S domain-containing protein n=1 Tax=Streptacidiphilus rugosus TaxID=405783 RepID=UPI0005651A4E|nr:Rieske 2Fe-2S domain-containing protein [Streptacidiphilus rugosus]